MNKTTNIKKKMFLISIAINGLAAAVLYFFDVASWDVILVIFLSGLFTSWTSEMLLYPEKSTNNKK